MFKLILKHFVFKHNKFVRLYKKLYTLRSDENAELLKANNYLYSIGNGCRINIGATFTDPKYVRIGNNTCLSNCTLIGHEGAVAVFSTATGKVLDKVGKIDIGNNCFVGHGAIILPDVTIGDNCIVAAGAVVSKNIEAGSIVGGIPAKVIGKTSEYIEKLENSTKEYPWYNLIKKREGIYDPELEKKLLKVRLEHFYNEK